ncbi:MAG: hypothetical protein Q9159_001895 [Coniocarpon cinnabarinum]
MGNYSLQQGKQILDSMYEHMLHPRNQSRRKSLEAQFYEAEDEYMSTDAYKEAERKAKADAAAQDRQEQEIEAKAKHDKVMSYQSEPSASDRFATDSWLKPPHVNYTHHPVNRLMPHRTTASSAAATASHGHPEASAAYGPQGGNASSSESEGEEEVYSPPAQTRPAAQTYTQEMYETYYHDYVQKHGRPPAPHPSFHAPASTVQPRAPREKKRKKKPPGVLESIFTRTRDR